MTNDNIDSIAANDVRPSNLSGYAIVSFEPVAPTSPRNIPDFGGAISNSGNHIA